MWCVGVICGYVLMCVGVICGYVLMCAGVICGVILRLTWSCLCQGVTISVL